MQAHTHTHTNEHKDFIAQVHSSHVPCMRAMTQARIKCNIRKKSCTLALTDTHSHSSAFRHTRARASKLPDLLVRGGGDAGVAVPPAHQPAAEGRGGGAGRHHPLSPPATLLQTGTTTKTFVSLWSCIAEPEPSFFWFTLFNFPYFTYDLMFNSKPLRRKKL